MALDSLSSAKPVWLVVNTQTHREAIAASNLRKQGYEVYAPAVRKQTRHARRAYEILAPLFPGYVFVQWRVSDMRWRPILSTVGVRTIVCNGDEPSHASFGDNPSRGRRHGVAQIGGQERRMSVQTVSSPDLASTSSEGRSIISVVS